MGIKRKCKTLRQKATAVVTKLAPGAFSQGETTMEMAPQLQLQRHSHKHALHPRLLYSDAIFRRRHKATYSN
jgi:hypothetical protein